MLYDCWMTRRSCAHKRRENNCANEQKGGMRRRRVCGRWLRRAAIRKWGSDSVCTWKLNIALSEQVQTEFTYRWLYRSGYTHVIILKLGLRMQKLQLIYVAACAFTALSFDACKQITELSSERNKHHWHCKKVGLLYNIWDMGSQALQHAWMLWIWIKMK